MVRPHQASSEWLERWGKGQECPAGVSGFPWLTPGSKAQWHLGQ